MGSRGNDALFITSSGYSPFLPSNDHARRSGCPPPRLRSARAERLQMKPSPTRANIDSRAIRA